MNTDHVEFLYAQSVDRNTPLEVTMRAFDHLVRQGKVLYYGLSNFPRLDDGGCRPHLAG